MTIVLRPDADANRLVSLACAMIGQRRYGAALVALDRAELRSTDAALRQRLRALRARIAQRASATGLRPAPVLMTPR